MTKKAKKTNKSYIKEVKSDIDELIQKINSSNDFFVIGKEVGYIVVGTVNSYTIRIEKSGNIFQPFGKNIMKNFPIYFPLVFDPLEANNAEIVYGFNEYEIPILHMKEHQIKMDEYAITSMLGKYFSDNF